MRNFWRNNSADEDRQIAAQELPDGRLVKGPALEIRSATAGSITYFGAALPLSDPADAVWQIFRIDETSGMHKSYADGSTDFDKVWNDRATYSY